jgi:iron complex outermembrane receptor protein
MTIGRRALFASTCIGAVFVGSSVSYAQSASAPTTVTTPGADATISDTSDTTHAQDIIVTGSRIAQPAVTAQPTITIRGGTIADLGFTNIGQALTQLPSFGVPGNSNIGPQGSFGAGQTFVNLYDLGAQRTLTLVNGNRFVSSASSSLFGAVQGTPVDLGQIAPELVDHVDVLSVGGAPIYGSDAIAGTVNVVLKKNYQGVSVTGSYGLAGVGDAADYNVSLIAGQNFADGRGNITLNVYYDHQNGLSDADRSAVSGTSTFYGVNPGDGPSFLRYTGGLHYSVFTNTGMPLVADDYPIISGSPNAEVTNAAGQSLFFNKAGHLTLFHDGTVLGNGITEAGGDGFPIDDFGNFLTNSQRIQGTLLAHYDFSDHFRFHGEFWLGRNTASNVSDQPYYSTTLFAAAGQPNGQLILSSSNPFLSAADQATIKSALVAAGQPDDTFYLARANTDLSTGAFRTQSTLYRIVAGVDGDFSLGSHNFTWEANFNYGHVTSNTTSRELVTQNFYNALDAVLDGSGNIACRPGYTSATIATISSTCAPLDIFGVGNASQAATNYITAIARTHQVDTQLDLVTDVKGDVLTLPAGKVQFALGYEHRRESQSFNPGAFFTGELQSDGSFAPYGNSAPIVAVAGAYHTDEGFGELNIPVISPDMDVPLVHRMDLNGAARFTHNSLTGGFWSYTGGGSIAPFEGLTFRGNFTRSFRSPSVTELFLPNSTDFETANDPCDPRFLSGGPNPSVRAANCAAAGLPANFITAANPTGKSHIVDFTTQGTSGGSTSLQNEKANSWTAGAVFQPKFIPGLTITGDYVNIDIKNEITLPGVEALMDACYDSPAYPSVAACSTFTRDAGGQVTSYEDNFFNIAIESFRAFQGTLNYTLPLEKIGLPESAGAINITANWLHTFKHITKVGEADVQQVLAKVADPSNAVQGSFDWATKKFDWLWQVTYYGPTRVDPNTGDGTYEFPTVSPYWMVDTSIGIKATDRFNIRLIANNVFNLGVPFPNTTVSQNKYYEAILGRFLRVNVTVKY